MELSASQQDSTPTPSLQSKLSAGDKAVPLPLYRVPGIIPHVERPEVSLQQLALGVSNKDIGGVPQHPPKVRAMQEPSAIGKAQ